MNPGTPKRVPLENGSHHLHLGLSQARSSRYTLISLRSNNCRLFSTRDVIHAEPFTASTKRRAEAGRCAPFCLARAGLQARSLQASGDVMNALCCLMSRWRVSRNASIQERGATAPTRVAELAREKRLSTQHLTMLSKVPALTESIEVHTASMSLPRSCGKASMC